MAKWLGKRQQSIQEALNKGTEKTEFEPEYVELEKRTDAFKNIAERMVKAVPLYLHPNPAARAKLQLVAGLNRVQRKAAAQRYPHPLAEVAENCSKGVELGDESCFGKSLVASADSFNRINDAHYSFDAEVQQSFLEPLKLIVDKDLKEIAHHRKKLEGRRLDYDFKRRQPPGKVPETEMRLAEGKVDETKGVCESAMTNLLNSDTEHVGLLSAFVKAYLEFMQSTVAILTDLNTTLAENVGEASSRPRRQRTAVRVQYDDDDDDDGPAASSGAGGERPSCRAVYDFEAENPGELSFSEGDIITLKKRIDDNWLEGEVRGRSGLFPSTYVEIIKDL